MKLKPFDFDEWNKDRNQNIYMRCGKKINKFTYFDLEESPFIKKTRPVFIGVMQGAASLSAWDINGRANEEAETYNDLMLVEKDVQEDSWNDVEEFIKERIQLYGAYSERDTYENSCTNYGSICNEYKEILEFIKTKRSE